jgi:PQQ-like domain/HEAT repeats
MAPRYLPLVVAFLVALPALTATSNPRSTDEPLSPPAREASGGDDLVEFFRSRGVSAKPDDVRRLIEQLGDDSFEVRRNAAQRLHELGGGAAPLLRAAHDHPDPEVRRAAADCLRRIDIEFSSPAVIAAAQRIAKVKPEGAAGALLSFLPAVGDERVLEELQNALVAVTPRNGQPDPAVVRALKDDDPTRRAAAGLALCRVGARDHFSAVRKLLDDHDPRVRLRVGLALAVLGERDAVLTLIPLLETLPRNQLAPVEDVLYALARENAPVTSMGRGAVARAKFRADWAAWWLKSGFDVDMTALREPAFLDHTLVLLLDEGKVTELDSDDRPLWSIDRLGFPLDLQLLPGGRVLVADNSGNRVVERHPLGMVLWETNATGPLVAQRLPNGNTFIATREELSEVDREGTVVWSVVRPAGDQVMRAVRLPDGDTAVISMTRQRFVRLDPQGKERSGFPVRVHTAGGRIDVRPDGCVLIPEKDRNMVVEYDATGKVLHEYPVDQPIAAVRLDNGNILATSMEQRRAIELDAAGKEIWSYRSSRSRVNRAWRR